MARYKGAMHRGVPVAVARIYGSRCGNERLDRFQVATRTRQMERGIVIRYEAVFDHRPAHNVWKPEEKGIGNVRDER